MEEEGNEGGDEKRDGSTSGMGRGWPGATKREHDEIRDGSDTRVGVDHARLRNGETVLWRRRAERTKQRQANERAGKAEREQRAWTM